MALKSITGKVQDILFKLSENGNEFCTISFIEKKSDGNLTAPEKSYMENVLYQLRMTYMRMQQVATTPPDELPEEPPEEADTDSDNAEATDGELPDEGEEGKEGKEGDVE